MAIATVKAGFPKTLFVWVLFKKYLKYLKIIYLGMITDFILFCHFKALLGQKYGYRPFPPNIVATEFEDLFTGTAQCHFYHLIPRRHIHIDWPEHLLHFSTVDCLLWLFDKLYWIFKNSTDSRLFRAVKKSMKLVLLFYECNTYVLVICSS